jgi:transcriptional regulator with XRE-family HTH domain
MLTAQELRSKRQQHKMTQAQLAQATGIEEDVLLKYEKGESPISAEHDRKLQELWRGTLAARGTQREQSQQVQQPEQKPAKKPSGPKAPSMTQWLQHMAQDPAERSGKSTPAQADKSGAKVSTESSITQALAQITNEKQRRAALASLLNAALSEIEDVLVEDKQLRATADAVEELQPTYKQLIMGMLDQLEQIKTPATNKAKGSTQEHIVQALKGSSPYETMLNYLQGAIQILKQAEIAEQPPLMGRLQKLSDFDRNTVSLMVKRYQEPRSAKTAEASPADKSAGAPQS